MYSKLSNKYKVLITYFNHLYFMDHINKDNLHDLNKKLTEEN